MRDNPPHEPPPQSVLNRRQILTALGSAAAFAGIGSANHDSATQDTELLSPAQSDALDSIFDGFYGTTSLLPLGVTQDTGHAS